MNSLDLNLFQTLKALYEERSVTLVARRFGLTQAAVSAQLAKLRQHYKDDLFRSTGRGMEPTALAHRLIGPAAELVQLAASASAIKADFDPLHHERRFSILAGTGYATTLLAEVGRILHDEAPGVHITLATFPSLDASAVSYADLLNKHRCDFAIVIEGSESPAHPMLELYSDDYVCLVDKDHPLLGDIITADQYYELTHVARQRDDMSARHEVISIGEDGRKRRIGPIVRTNALVPFFIIGTTYVATVPRRFALGTAARLPVRIVELPVKAAAHKILLQWPHHLDHEPGAIWLRDKIRQVASGLPR